MRRTAHGPSAGAGPGGPSEREFDGRFRWLVRRLRLRSAVRLCTRLAPWLQGLVLLWILATRFGVVELGPGLWWLLGGGGLALATGAGIAMLRSVSGMRAALLADRDLRSREVVTAAWEAAPASEHPLARRARRRAAALLDPGAARRAFPVVRPASLRPTLLGLIGLALAPLLLSIPPRDIQAAAAPPDPHVEAKAEALARELDALSGKLAELARPEAEAVRETLKELADLAAALKDGDVPSAEEALLRLEEVERSFEAMQGELETGSLGDLVAELGQEPLSQDLALAMTKLDRPALRQALQELAEASAGPLSGDQGWQRQLQRFANRLEAMASALKLAGEPDLAQVLRELEAAIESGDMDRAREILDSLQVVEALATAGELALSGEAAQELEELLQFARYLLGQDRPRSLESSRECRDGESCAGGTTPRAGEGQTGPDPGTASTNLEQAGYETVDPRLRDRQTEARSSREASMEELYESRFSSVEEWEDVRARGKRGEQGEMLSEVGRGLGVDRPTSQPLRSFDPVSAGSAESAIDLENVPLGYREIVRRYFERNAAPGQTSSPGRRSPP